MSLLFKLFKQAIAQRWFKPFAMKLHPCLARALLTTGKSQGEFTCVDAGIRVPVYAGFSSEE